VVLGLQAEQRTRFLIRQIDPVRQWKLSPTDLASLDKWDDYTAAKEAMFFYTHTADAPVDGREEQRQEARRLEAMRHVLHRCPTPTRTRGRDGTDPLLVGSASEVFEDDDPPVRCSRRCDARAPTGAGLSVPDQPSCRRATRQLAAAGVPFLVADDSDAFLAHSRAAGLVAGSR
jgi:hypothetical protein